MSKKQVLVTGASRGIGRSIALSFARHGYHVFLNCRSTIAALENVQKEILSIPGGSAEMLPGNVGNPKEVEDMFQHISHSCDSLDVLINNAGIAHFGLLSDTTDEEWSDMIQTNLSSAFYCSRAAVPPMVRKKQGRIINISSIWGLSGASCEVAYSAAKSGLHGLTRALAKELAPSNVQVNAVACGYIDTQMNTRLTKEEQLAFAETIPAGRFGTTEEVANLIFQLATSPEYLTGQIITMDGGYL
ncbi:3-oxoacyl-ACP reductase FabG [Lachnospiraceae bacterium OttesenSCG-928-E19]|nr:3-oxoacyl-ACP reductase FabG [Lachnospiraceae bacterium OttesenSCG-928-E19]